MSTPSSLIKICSDVRLNNRYEHTIYFSSPSDQLAYFTGKVVKTFSGYTFLRKSWDIKVDANMEEARTWSYLFFQNGSGKAYFYFITNIEYVGENTVRLMLELDVMQSYFFDVTIPPCFVEREHSVTDNVGENLVEEGLDTGELINHGLAHDIGRLTTMYIMVLSTRQLTEEIKVRSVYNDIYCGFYIYAIDVDDARSLEAMLNVMDEEGASDAIISIWMYPQELVLTQEEASGNPTDFPVKLVQNTEIYRYDTLRKPTDINGYVPRNKKLLCYPYNFLYCTNNNGVSAVYHYERFEEDTLTFGVYGTLTPEGQTVLVPNDYNGQYFCYDEALLLSGYPSCAWNQDVYKLWLAQNQNQQNLAMATSGLTIAGGAVASVASFATGNIMGGVAGLGAVAKGGGQIASLMAQRADRAIQPPQAKGKASGCVNMTTNRQTYSFYSRGVDEYHAKMLDDYFSMYGYKCMKVKEPNRNSRKHFNHVKTVGCHVVGNLCSEDLAKIESIYNEGVTFWKNGDNIGKYTTEIIEENIA